MSTAFPKPKNTFLKLAEAKRQKIDQALVLEFAENGYRKASLNTIARQSGIAKGSLYQYFVNKEGIFLYVFDRFTDLVKEILAKSGQPDQSDDFWGRVEQVLWAGVEFIDSHPQYYRLYLRVLFEHEVPRREELIGRVRLFSMDYFRTLVLNGQQSGAIRSDITQAVAIFMFDAVLDRFLQGYARSYLDAGLDLASKSQEELADQVTMVMKVLREGLTT